MKFKKIFLLICLLICVFSMASVCASEANDTAIASEDNLEIDQTDDLIGVEEDTNLTSSDENEILSECEKTFGQLDEAINGNNDKDVYLSGNYQYSSGDDFKEGIAIMRDVNIYGNGATIDGNKEARIFQVYGGNVAFHNIIFVNGNVEDDVGGAIYGNCRAINCIFKENHANQGGAMYGGSAVNCTFSGNTANELGGAMYGGSAVKCSFVGNSAEDGGAMYDGSAVNCTFSGNTAEDDGGAMYGGSAVNCSFVGNSAEDGGAMYGGSAVNCTFSGNTAEDDGGAMYDGSAVNCTFSGNTASSHGGAMYDGSAVNCTFSGNTANQGGAMYGGSAVNCTFSGNTASSLGGAMFEGSAVNCSFSGNTANELGGAMWYGSAVNCSFSGNTANRGGAMYGGSAVFCIFETSSDTLYNTNIPTFTVSKHYFRFDHGDKLLFNLTYDNKNYDGYNTTITLTKGGNPVGVYYALSGSDEGWYADLSPGIYRATLSMEQYAVNPITVDIITGMNVDPTTYFGLIEEIGDGGNINLTESYYNYTGGHTIEIKNSGVINGNGAVIDMAGSNIRAFYVSASGVTIRNLTIKNADIDGDGGAIYFGVAGTVENCTFINNIASADGGALSGGEAHNCNFISNFANNGGAINNGKAYKCDFTENHANENGGAINEGSARDCSFSENTAEDGGGAMYGGSAVRCSFVDNSAEDGGAMYDGSAVNCNFVGNSAKVYGGAMYEGYKMNCIGQNDYFDTEDLYLQWDANDFTTCYGLAEKLPIQLRNLDNDLVDFINYDAVIYKEDSEVKTYHCLSNEGLSLDLAAGIYTAELIVTYPGLTMDSNYIIIILTINKATPKIEVQAYDATYPGSVVVNVKSDVGGVYVVRVGGKSQSVTLNAGVGENITFTGLPANESGYVINVTHNSENYTGFNDTVKVIVHKATPRIEVVAYDVTYPNVVVSVKSDVGGVYVVGIGGKSQSVTLNAGVGENITFTGLSANESGYVINVTHNSENYTGFNDAVNVIVHKATPGIEVVAYDVTYPNVVVSVESDVGGVYVVRVGDKSQSVTLNAGVGQNITFTGLAASEEGYVVNVTNLDVENCTAVVNDAVKVIVHKATPGIEVVAYDVTYPNVVVSVKSDVGGVYVVRVGGKSQSVTLNAGVGENITFTGLAASEEGYVVNVTNLDVENCTAVVNDAVKVIVHKATPRIEVYGYDATYPGDAVVNVKSDVDGVYVVGIGDKSQSVTLEAGVGQNIIFTGLPANEEGYVVNVTCGASENYTEGINDAVVVKIRKASVKIISQEITATYNINRDLVIALKDANGNPLTGVELSVNLNGVKDYVTDKSGQIKVPTKGLAAKTYTAKITFNGNANYIGSAKSVKVTVKKATPKLTAKSKKFKKSVKVKKYTVTLKDNTGKAMKKVQLTIKIGKKTFKAKTNNKGKATFKIKKLTKKGKYKATVTYKGNKNYNKVTKKVKITVK